jgi:hypothetical protein
MARLPLIHGDAWTQPGIDILSIGSRQTQGCKKNRLPHTKAIA